MIIRFCELKTNSFQARVLSSAWSAVVSLPLNRSKRNDSDTWWTVPVVYWKLKNLWNLLFSTAWGPDSGYRRRESSGFENRTGNRSQNAGLSLSRVLCGSSFANRRLQPCSGIGIGSRPDPASPVLCPGPLSKLRFLRCSGSGTFWNFGIFCEWDEIRWDE